MVAAKLSHIKFGRGFEGPQRWAVKIFSNDPKWEQAVLDLRANVKPVIKITGSPVFLDGKKKASITGEVEIGTELNKPLILTPEQFTLRELLSYKIDEIEKGKRFRISFTNIPGQVGNFRGVLKLQTNYPEKPELAVLISARYVGTQKVT